MIRTAINDDTSRMVFSQPNEVDKVLMNNPMCSSGVTDEGDTS